MQQDPSFGMASANVAQDRATDEKVAEDMISLQREAQERLTFHRVECERWNRIGQAATMALTALQSTVPIEKATAEAWAVEFDGGDEGPRPSRY